EEEVLEALLMADADVADLEAEDNMITIFAPHTEFFKIKNALSESFPNTNIDVEEITFVPQTNVAIGGDDVAMFEKFIDMLNDCDDVQNVYHNAQID
ncbi:MAG: YebC/PmpR family DNA-binding transcriptional regulator, partial [Vibrionaceae bacterium]